jgi:hypothetical protein
MDNQLYLDEFSGLGVTIQDLNDPDYLDGLADTVGLVRGKTAMAARSRATTLRTAGVKGSGKNPKQVIQSIENMMQVVLNDEITLASGTLNVAAFPSTPSAAGARTNYKRQPFNYDLLVISEIKARLDTMLITDAIRAELLNAQVLFKKGSREILRTPLSELFGGLDIATTHLNTTSISYAKQDGSLKLMNPIALNNLDDISFDISFVATTNLDTKKLKIYLVGMGKEKYA